MEAAAIARGGFDESGRSEPYAGPPRPGLGDPMVGAPTVIRAARSSEGERASRVLPVASDPAGGLAPGPG